MVFKLYGSPYSTCTARVGATLHEHSVPFQIIPISLKDGEHKSADFLKKQPFGQVPYIDDDGVIVYESRAIARYIAAKFPTSAELLPSPVTATAKYAKFEQAASVEVSHFDPAASLAAKELIFRPMYGAQGNEALAKEQLVILERTLDVYETILSGQKYIAGDEVTLADIFHLPYGNLLHTKGFINLEDEKRPNVARWWKEITARPSWQTVKAGVTSTA